MKRPLAALTLVCPDTAASLPRWLRHYARAGAALYVLNAGAALDEAKSPVPFVAFPAIGPECAERFLRTTLYTYETAVRTEPNELLFPHPDYGTLADYVRKRPIPQHISATGYDVSGDSWRRNRTKDVSRIHRTAVMIDLPRPDPSLYLLNLVSGFLEGGSPMPDYLRGAME